jgi:hypothetical protein
LAFGVEIDKDVVRRILSVHYRPESVSGGPSWLTFLGQTKDSLWSCDLFRCESATLRTHCVLVVMNQFTRRIIGFGVHGGIVNGVALCRMFQRAIGGHGLPKYLSSDHDPLYRFHQWHANLRVLEVAEIKTIPYVPLSHHVPLSHPFVERLIGTVRREYLDRTLFGPQSIWKRSYSIFNITITAIERMRGWKDTCQSPLLTNLYHQSVSLRIGGGGTVEGCTRLHSRHNLSIRHQQVFTL